MKRALRDSLGSLRGRHGPIEIRASLGRANSLHILLQGHETITPFVQLGKKPGKQFDGLREFVKSEDMRIDSFLFPKIDLADYVLVVGRLGTFGQAAAHTRL